MFRHVFALVLLVAVSVAVAAPTVVVNGNPVTLPVTDVGGKAFVDVVALMQLLGGKATYDAAADKLFINTTAGGGGGGPVTLADFGTAQLAGDNGEFGKVYKLRNGSPVYFRLNSAEYTVSQLRFGTALVAPEGNQKLLVLHFSVQNPQQTEAVFRFDTLKFTVVDEMNVNHEAVGRVGDEQTKGDLSMRLKPAQRIEGYTCFLVPARGVVPKLMVQPPTANDGPILRYDLRDHVNPLPAGIADPNDPSGATALETVPVALNTPISLRYFDVTLEQCEMVDTPLDAGAPPLGGKFMLVTALVKNETGMDMPLRFDTFVTTLKDEGGQVLKAGRQLLGAMANVGFNQRTTSGEEVRVRFYFTVPAGVTPKTLSIREATSRTYEFDVSK